MENYLFHLNIGDSIILLTAVIKIFNITLAAILNLSFQVMILQINQSYLFIKMKVNRKILIGNLNLMGNYYLM